MHNTENRQATIVKRTMKHLVKKFCKAFAEKDVYPTVQSFFNEFGVTDQEIKEWNRPFFNIIALGCDCKIFGPEGGVKCWLCVGMYEEIDKFKIPEVP